LRSEKDEEVKIAAVKYRRLKELNTARNDYLETLLFEKNINIIPTLKHNKGTDFYIDGISFDQKVAKSPTQEFIKKYGDE
jgi:glycine cleavage system protein P-like pyridoxal-binding family